MIGTVGAPAVNFIIPSNIMHKNQQLGFNKKSDGVLNNIIK